MLKHRTESLPQISCTLFARIDGVLPLCERIDEDEDGKHVQDAGIGGACDASGHASELGASALAAFGTAASGVSRRAEIGSLRARAAACQSRAACTQASGRTPHPHAARLQQRWGPSHVKPSDLCRHSALRCSSAGLYECSTCVPAVAIHEVIHTHPRTPDPLHQEERRRKDDGWRRGWLFGGNAARSGRQVVGRQCEELCGVPGLESNLSAWRLVGPQPVEATT
ncbi:hypothetical protein DFH27DRAFT_526578 [Peziza echinospora]|nr:hypothetical protein DFH27DRAFT_526578 [Peziza echinospora]